MNLRIEPPLAVFLGIIIFCMGGVLLLQMLLQKDLYFLGKIFFGHDYKAIYDSAKLILEGTMPYGKTTPNNFMPPTSALASIPLTRIPFERATLIVSLLTYAAVAGSFFLAHRAFNALNLKKSAIVLLFCIGIPLFSYPFYFLFDRGNIDGIVLLFTCLGIYLVFRSRAGWLSHLLAGVFFGVAVSLKIYPLLIIFPLVAQYRWKALASMAVVLVAIIYIDLPLWQAFFETTLERRTTVIFDRENGSLFSTFSFLGGLIGYGEQAKGMAFPVWLMLLGIMFYVDITNIRNADDKTSLSSLVFYLPFMVAVPHTVFHYEFVFLLITLPAISWLWTNTTRNSERAVLLLISAGVGLSQFQVAAVEILYGTKGFSQWVPGFGLLMVLTGVFIYKAMYLYAGNIGAIVESESTNHLNPATKNKRSQPAPDIDLALANNIKLLAKNYSTNFTGLRKLMVRYRPYICPFYDILKNTPEKSSLLDIGCGAGLFLYMHGKINKPDFVAGVDTNTKLNGHIKKLLARKLPHTKRNIFNSISAVGSNNLFDVVTMIDVIHHVPVDKQLEFLREAASHVAPGGSLIYKDMSSSFPYGEANRLHDLIIAREWIHYLPIQSVIDELSQLGFSQTAMSQRTTYWYKHEMVVMRREHHNNS